MIDALLDAGCWCRTRLVVGASAAVAVHHVAFLYEWVLAGCNSAYVGAIHVNTSTMKTNVFLLVMQELQQQQHRLKEQLFEVTQKLQLMERENTTLQQQLTDLQAQQQQQQDQQAQQSTADEAAAAETQLQEQMQRLGRFTISRSSSTDQQQQQQHEEEKASGRQNGSMNGLLQQLGLVGSHKEAQDPSQGSSPLARLGSSRDTSQQQLQGQMDSSGSAHLSLARAISGIPEILQLQRLVQQQQQELAAAVKERDAAAEQLYQAMRQTDAAAAAVHETERLRQQQKELEKKVC